MTPLLYTLTTVIGAATVPEEVVAQFEDRTIRYTGGPYQDEIFHYRLLRPRAIEPGRQYPLVLFLHGAGERGSDNVKQLLYFPALMAGENHRREYPCFIIAPQCREEFRWVEVPWTEERSTPMQEMSDQMRVVVSILDAAMEDLPVDPGRVYLTGLSMGGYGAWDLAMRYPERFAAVAPICGGGDESQAGKLADVPVWAFHGEADKAVPVVRSRRMIDAIRAAGGQPKYTELPGVGHNSWTPAYGHPGGLVPWMFQQRKE